MDQLHYQIHTERAIANEKIKIDYLTCVICLNILWRPEKCSQCHTHYCQYCIRFTLLKTKKCPSCALEYVAKSADHFLVQDLRDIQVKCVYSYNGCNKVFEYDFVISHENECIYKEIPCEECSKHILKKNYHTHIILCKNSLSNNLKIDYDQIIFYFKDKLNKIEKENQDDLEKIKKNFNDVYVQKQTVLTSLVEKMEKQQKILEDLSREKEKVRNMSEDELKTYSAFQHPDNNLSTRKQQSDNCKII